MADAGTLAPLASLKLTSVDALPWYLITCVAVELSKRRKFSWERLMLVQLSCKEGWKWGEPSGWWLIHCGYHVQGTYKEKSAYVSVCIYTTELAPNALLRADTQK